MRLALPAAALGLGFAALFLSTPGTVFNWDALFLAENLRSGDWTLLVPPYRPLSTLAALLWWPTTRGFLPDPLAALQVLSALLSAGTLTAFFILLARQTRSLRPALLATLGAGVSMGFWFHATHPKWYGFTNLCLVGLLLALQASLRGPATLARSTWLGVAAGLTVLVHGTFVSLAAALAAVWGLRCGRRHAVLFLAVATLVVLLGVGASLALAQEVLPEGTLARTLSEDFQSRNLLQADFLRPFQGLTLLWSGWREPSGEVLGLPGWPRVVAPWALGLVLLGFGILARRFREASPLEQVLGLFILFHLTLLGLVDPPNENLAALVLAFWGLAAGALGRHALLASVGVGALALTNFCLFIEPNRWPERNPHLVFVREALDWMGPDGLLLSRDSLRTRYCLYALGERLVMVHPGNPISLHHARQRVYEALAEGTRVVADPILFEHGDGWADAHPEAVEEFFRGTSWEPLAPGVPVLKMRDPGREGPGAMRDSGTELGGSASPLPESGSD